MDRYAMRDWWKGRAIPASRSGLGEFLEQLHIDDVGPLVVRSMGLSLSDHYWIKPIDSELTWNAINFFDNDFSDDIGDLLFGNVFVGGEFSFMSPDNTSDGVLRKRWKIIDGKRYLVKCGDDPYFQEPFNEVVASGIMELLDIPHVEYGFLVDGSNIYCVCEDMATSGIELVPAARAFLASRKPNDRSSFNHYVEVCREHGLDVRSDLDRMLLIDYIMCNRDRHYNNFGILRDSGTLDWISSAPIYDTGSSLGSNVLTERFDQGSFEACKPFAKTFSEQNKLISSLGWIDREALSSIPSVVEEVFSESNGWQFPERTSAIVKLVGTRVDAVRHMM